MPSYDKPPHRPPCTIAALLAASISANVDRPAILAPGRPALTYGALARQFEATASALAQAGHGRGSRIALALPDGPEFAVAVLTVSSCATCAPLNPALDEAAIARLLAAMRIDALVVPEGEQSAATRAAKRAGISTIALRFSPMDAAGNFELPRAPCNAPATNWPPGVSDVALLMHTSGTTSAPKIVPLTQGRIAEAALARVEASQITRDDRCLLATPLHTAAGIRRSLLPPLVIGGSVVCPAGRFDAAEFVDWLERFAPTFYAASVTVQAAVLEEVECRARPLRHALRFVVSGGARLPAATQRKLEAALGVPVIQGYGMTETGSIAQTPMPPVRTPVGSLGLPANIEVAITDPNGLSLGPGETGEIVVRGPEVFDGYESNDDANAAAFRDGWFRTGDAGHVDADGFVFLAGRMKDVINRGGFKVAPTEVEEALAEHPHVVDVAAFSLPHPTLVEDVAAAVVLRGGQTVTESELHAFARTCLPPSKLPTRIITLPALPRGPFGKVQRGELARIAQDFLTTDFVAPRDSDEAQVAAMVAEILGLQRVGVHDNFFQLGGDSLRGARLVTRVQSVFGVSLAMNSLFARPTVAGIVGDIRKASAQGAACAGSAIKALPRSPTRARAPRHVNDNRSKT